MAKENRIPVVKVVNTQEEFDDIASTFELNVLRTKPFRPSPVLVIIKSGDKQLKTGDYPTCYVGSATKFTVSGTYVMLS